jgi:hypothetical protein
VYEKERRLRMMMKMHGLGDSVYWLVCYVWYLLLHLVYILVSSGNRGQTSQL